MTEPSKIKVYRCDNPACDMFDRQWQSFVGDPNIHELREQYDADGNLVRDSDGTADLLRVEVDEPSDHMRSKCPSCGEVGKKVAPGNVLVLPGTEVL